MQDRRTSQRALQGKEKIMNSKIECGNAGQVSAHRWENKIENNKTRIECGNAGQVSAHRRENKIKINCREKYLEKTRIKRSQGPSESLLGASLAPLGSLLGLSWDLLGAS